MSVCGFTTLLFFGLSHNWSVQKHHVKVCQNHCPSLIHIFVTTYKGTTELVWLIGRADQLPSQFGIFAHICGVSYIQSELRTRRARPAPTNWSAMQYTRSLSCTNLRRSFVPESLRKRRASESIKYQIPSQPRTFHTLIIGKRQIMEEIVCLIKSEGRKLMQLHPFQLLKMASVRPSPRSRHPYMSAQLLNLCNHFLIITPVIYTWRSL